MGDEGVAKRDRSFQLKMKTVCSAKPICALPCLAKVFPSLPWNCSRISLVDDGNGPLSSFQGRSFSASSSHVCLLEVIADVQKGQICLNMKVWTSVPGREGAGGRLRLEASVNCRCKVISRWWLLSLLLHRSTLPLAFICQDPMWERATCETTCERDDDDDDDCFYIALFSALKQTHCARMWFYVSD